MSLEQKKRGNHDVVYEYPIIVLNHSRERVKLLNQKLGEYKKRLDPKRSWMEQLILTASPAYKVAILENLLKDKILDPLNIRMELEHVARSYFDLGTFENALGVIRDYNKTGGINIIFGTGISGNDVAGKPGVPNSRVNYDETAVYTLK